MKRNIRSLLAAVLMLVLSTACNKDIGNAGGLHAAKDLCNYSPAYNADFSRIDANTTYNDLFKLFLANGDNYQSDATNYDTIDYYRWYPCTDSAYYLECDLEGGRLLMAQKTFSDTSCSKNINLSAYESLITGMAFSQVRIVLNGPGDNFRNDYEIPGNYLKTAWYRFVDCSDTTRRIEVQVSPVSGVTQLSKSF